MTTHRTGTDAGGERAGSIGRGTSHRIGYVLNHNDTDFAARREEVLNLVRSAMGVVARQLLVAVPPSHRSKSETDFLQDVARDRRAASPETLGAILAVQRRADYPHLFSEAVRGVELGLAPVAPLCPFEASEAEQQANAPLDLAQLIAAKDKSRTRWEAVRDYAAKQLHATRRLLDAASLHLSTTTEGR